MEFLLSINKCLIRFFYLMSWGHIVKTFLASQGAHFPGISDGIQCRTPVNSVGETANRDGSHRLIWLTSLS